MQEVDIAQTYFKQSRGISGRGVDMIAVKEDIALGLLGGELCDVGEVALMDSLGDMSGLEILCIPDINEEKILELDVFKFPRVMLQVLHFEPPKVDYFQVK